MIYIKFHSKIENPEGIKSLPILLQNDLRENFEKGLFLVLVPNDFHGAGTGVNLKKHKNVYKIGFIYDCLTILYPEYGKEKKQEIISEAYHFSFTYRQFKSLYDIYDKNREKYIKNRGVLGLCQ